MTDRDRRSEFLNFMRMPDGSPLTTLDILDYPNVLWTHQADMLASHVEGV